jgi:hypothetical protein
MMLKNSSRVWFTILLLTIPSVPAAAEIAQAYLHPNAYLTCVRVQEAILYCRTVTAEHNATMGFEANGIFHEQKDRDGWLFWLQSGNGNLRLIFYCKPQNETETISRNQLVTAITVLPNGKTVTTIFGQAPIIKMEAWNFCTEPDEISLVDGQEVQLKGTLIQPSEWNPALSEHHLQFIGDLYVFEVG